MRIESLSFAALMVAASCGGTAGSSPTPPPTHEAPAAQISEGRSLQSPYPHTRQVDQVDDYHGVQVADPYRWLEDDRNAEVMAWIAAQNRLTDAALVNMQHGDAIREALRKAWSFPRQSAPIRHGTRHFDRRNTGTQTQDVLWVQEHSQAHALLDPVQLPENSPESPASLAGYAATHDGSLLAYAVSQAGSDWLTLRVREVQTGHDLEDRITDSKFATPAWKRDNSGFFYARFERPAAGKQARDADGPGAIYWHTLGTPEADDREVFRHPDPAFTESVEVSHDGRWLVISASKSSGHNELWVQDLTSPEAAATRLAHEGSNLWVGNDATSFWLQTTAGAPRGRVLRAPLPGHTGAAQEVIAEGPDALEEVHWAGERLLVSSLHDARSQLQLYTLTGEPTHAVNQPEIGSVSDLQGDPDDSAAFYTFQNATTPPTVYRLDTATHTQEVWFAPQLPVATEELVTEQVFFPSADGTGLTAFISHRKDAGRNGEQPTLLYGYGGFQNSVTPTFNPANLVWMLRGGTYVSAVLRGGGEYGDEWHRAGTQQHKQRMFDDFIAAAEYLIQEKYTSSKRLAIHGASNGGLLVGACMTQRPELFAAALPEVGVLDMLRYERFTTARHWIGDYGSVENPEDFKALYAYSPLHKVRDGGRYPRTLIITGDQDDRVVPGHSFKFAARLQAAQADDGAPILLRVLHGTGHGAGRGLEQRIDVAAQKLTFLENALRTRRGCCCHKDKR